MDFTPHIGSNKDSVVGIPCALLGLWTEYTSNGRAVPWKRLVEPAHKLASEGFKMDQNTLDALEELNYKLNRPTGVLADTFFTNGKPKAKGSLITQPVLADKLSKLMNAEDPLNDFYHGDMAAEIAAASGDAFTAEDMARAHVDRNPGLSIFSHGYEIVTTGGTSGGKVLAMGLNVLEPLIPSAHDKGWFTPETASVFAETFRAAQMKHAHGRNLGTGVYEQSAKDMESKDWASEFRQTWNFEEIAEADPELHEFEGRDYDAEAAHSEGPQYAYTNSHHLYFKWRASAATIVDGNGGVVALEQTVQDYWGRWNSTAGFSDVGFALNTFGAGGAKHRNFPSNPVHGERSIHALAPAVLSLDGKVVAAVAAGGHYGALAAKLGLLVYGTPAGWNHKLDIAFTAPRIMAECYGQEFFHTGLKERLVEKVTEFGWIANEKTLTGHGEDALTHTNYIGNAVMLRRGHHHSWIGAAEGGHYAKPHAGKKSETEQEEEEDEFEDFEENAIEETRARNNENDNDEHEEPAADGEDENPELEP
eukprot:NODE_535_length_1833_cov_71.107268_g527_i0.p1 GENE.NODE_535_length_1833_cov_71.107268_g527_i0~~NODE_535_length_1833_cov_71.107268_g527_i0.p1  ORF type:complete len:593 (+),score=159.60 NODE_535_length_1833_cov_71.107268_g527_i0:179-1780(+)